MHNSRTNFQYEAALFVIMRNNPIRKTIDGTFYIDSLEKLCIPEGIDNESTESNTCNSEFTHSVRSFISLLLTEKKKKKKKELLALPA